jgi:hypothetical protein
MSYRPPRKRYPSPEQMYRRVRQCECHSNGDLGGLLIVEQCDGGYRCGHCGGVPTPERVREARRSAILAGVLHGFTSGE